MKKIPDREEETKAQEHTSMHPYKQIICPFPPFQHIIVDHSFIALSADLVLEEDQVILIVIFTAKVLWKLVRIFQVVNNGLVNRPRRPLNAFIEKVMTMDLFRGCAERVDRQKMVGYMIVKAFLVEEDVMSFVIFL